ncbi:hypothetical protein BC351_23440 [Paenibacillus ferrarius]|uniref:Orc1-like AAA ATPase domain-containing protein n=1 Tax=Paenibacillus ferrarius TaxID=1469647 RepID=A0A1V4HMW6_9BACL|nr:tetratricopeptide repeat protein [Paenibacillus ferrarius]OPH58323.1 hypothetical protein BC351_23440 [Paenibacillus ferrarius]
MINNLSRAREALYAALDSAWELVEEQDKTYLCIYGESGVGKKDTLKQWMEEKFTQDTLIHSDGKCSSHGYFAGLDVLIHSILKEMYETHPEFIHKHEQSLKRLFPYLPANYFALDKDLTNLASPDERTRFYHHEYQEKLLHGVYECLLEAVSITGRQFKIIIHHANELSQTVKTFLRIFHRRNQLSKSVRIVLLCDQPLDPDMEEAAVILSFQRMTRDEFRYSIGRLPQGITMSSKQIDLLYEASGGNMAKLYALLDGMATGLDVNPYLPFHTYLDFCLQLKGEKSRYRLLKAFIEGNCASDDPMALRNYATYHPETRARLHREQIKKLHDGSSWGNLLHPVHALSLLTQAEQLEALAPLSIQLQEIGLYDTWFDMFSPYYTSSHLRVLPDGEQPYNSVFIRMSFILYSLGLSRLSIPYLELFYHQFPESHAVPMILYSQSMTYGRYQIPVDLPKAEYYALLNLEKIDQLFFNHPKYDYIMVFAENALAYIRARQGRFEEAIELCTKGLARMDEIYGNEKYALHQSILVYNTGQVYELVGDFDKAYETYKHAIALDPNYGEYYNDMANLLKKAGKFEDALAYYDKAIELCPPYYEAHINRGDLYEKLGRIAEAEADYQRALILKPDTAIASLGLGVMYYLEGRYAESLEMLNHTLYHQPKEAQAYNNRALVFQELDRLQEAAQDLDHAILLNPKLSEAYNNRAIMYFHDERYEDCRKDLECSLELQKDPDIYMNLSMLYRKQGQLNEALEQLRTARENFGSSEALNHLLLEIEEELVS